MEKAEVLDVSVDEADAIAAIVRQADRDELTGALGLDMPHALRLAFGGSLKANKIVAGGKVVAVFGDAVHCAQAGIGVPWLISTEHVEQHARSFLRVCRPAVLEMLERHVHLINYVDARNAQAVRWLAWLGFVIEEPTPYGPHGVPFHKFTMSREV